MTHTSRDMARARSRCPQYRGYAALVRDALSRVGKPISAYGLTLACGLGVRQVKRGIRSLMNQGGVVSTKATNGVTYYSLWAPAVEKPVPKEKGEFAIAGPITIPQLRWGGTRLG